MTPSAVPMPSTRCQQSLEIVSGLYSYEWGSKTSLNEWNLTWRSVFSGACAFLVYLLYWQRYCLVEILSFRLKNNMRIEYKHRLTCFYELYGYNLDFFVWFFWLSLSLYWRKRANKTEVFGYKETSSNKRNIYWVNEGLLIATIWRSSKVRE